jgi:hypothetical protein
MQRCPQGHYYDPTRYRHYSTDSWSVINTSMQALSQTINVLYDV